jgi:hypothetical protein
LIAACRRVARHAAAEEKHRLCTVLDEYKEFQTKYTGISRKCAEQVAGSPPFSKTLHAYLERIDDCITGIGVRFRPGPGLTA